MHGGAEPLGEFARSSCQDLAGLPEAGGDLVAHARRAPLEADAAPGGRCAITYLFSNRIVGSSTPAWIAVSSQELPRRPEGRRAQGLDGLRRIRRAQRAMRSFSALLPRNVLNSQQWRTREDLHCAIVHWIDSSPLLDDAGVHRLLPLCGLQRDLLVQVTPEAQLRIKSKGLGMIPLRNRVRGSAGSRRVVGPIRARGRD